MSEAKAGPLVVVMGVTGAGKTRIGKALAAHLQVEYGDGDTFHSAVNIAKMARGTPLDDEDRTPWLLAIATFLHERRERGAVVSCSALRRRYRDQLRAVEPRLCFLHLTAEPQVVEQRVTVRGDHFMPPSLVASQFAILQPLGPDEPGVTLDAQLAPERIVAEFLARV
jgi:gluconokinase